MRSASAVTAAARFQSREPAPLQWLPSAIGSLGGRVNHWLIGRRKRVVVLADRWAGRRRRGCAPF